MPTFYIEELAALINGEVNGMSSVMIDNVASLSLAKPQEIACFSNLSQLPFLASCRAGVILTTSSLASYCDVPCIIVPMVHNSLPKLIKLFKPIEESLDKKISKPVIHPSAVIGQNVKLGNGIIIGAFVNIEDNVVIDNNCSISSHCFIGKNSKIGEGTIIKVQAAISPETIIGKFCVIDIGTNIGAMPYNPIKDKGQWHLSRAVGRVIIDDKVNIGSNSVIDVGAHGDTFIGAGVKIDNLVQIAHDVIIGEHTAIAANAIVGANTIIGKHCTIGGGSCIAGQLTIADDIVLTGRTTVTRSLLKVDIYSSGITAQPHNIWRRNVARFHRLNDSIKRLRSLKTKVDELKKESV